MRRREFIGLLGGAAVGPSLPVVAQQPNRLPIVALVFSTAPLGEMVGSDPVSRTARAFVHGLRDLGWIDGRTIVIERRSAEGMPQRAPAIFTELLARGVDVMMVAGERWLHLAAQQATRTISIVATLAEDPVATGLIVSLARPGGNLTGIALTTGHELTLKRLQLFKEMAPQIARIAYLATQSAVDQYRGGAGFPGVTVMLVRVDRPEQYDEAFATILRERADALMLSTSPIHYVNAQRIVSFANESRVPTMYAFREAVEAGGLVSYGANAPGLWRQAARLVDRVLKGAHAGDLPVEQPTSFELVINLKTAKALGLEVPPTLLARADEVIE